MVKLTLLCLENPTSNAFSEHAERNLFKHNIKLLSNNSVHKLEMGHFTTFKLQKYS